MKMDFTLGIREKFMGFVLIILFLLGTILTGASIVQQRTILRKLDDELQNRGMFLSENLAANSLLNILLNDIKSMQESIDLLEDEFKLKMV